jgi:hypothetical protein
VIARRERRSSRVLTNGITWRRSCGDDHTTALNRGGRWCFDGEMVSGARMRDWCRVGAMDNEGTLIEPFIVS